MITMRTNDYTVGFHNFDLRIFILRVSNPSKLIVVHARGAGSRAAAAASAGARATRHRP